MVDTTNAGAYTNLATDTLDRLEGLAKEYSKSVEKLNKTYGGFGIGLTKFGSLNSKLEKLSERLDLEQKQTKALLGFQTTFESLLSSQDANLQDLIQSFGPTVIADTIQDALAAGGPIMPEAAQLGAMITATGRDSAKLFKFLNEFKSITGSTAQQQKTLVSNLKDNFSRQDAVISALESLIDTLESAAGISSKIPENISNLVNDLSKSFPGLESQFAKLFKTYLSDPTISRGYLGKELQQANKEIVEKLMSKNLTGDEVLSFIDRITNSPEIKARETMFAQMAESTGLLPDAITGMSSMLGEFAKEARQTNAAVGTNLGLTKPSIKFDIIEDQTQLLQQIVKQLSITTEKLDRNIELSQDDFTQLTKLFQSMGLSVDLDSIPKEKITLEKLAQQINTQTTDQVKKLRDQEQSMSDWFTTYRELKDVADAGVGVWEGWTEIQEEIQRQKEKERALGKSCETPMHVRICDGAVVPMGDGKSKDGKKDDMPPPPKSWWEKTKDIFKTGWNWVKSIGIFVRDQFLSIVAILITFKDKIKKIIMGPIAKFFTATLPNWFKGLSLLGKFVVIGVATAVVAAILALINAMLEVGGTASKQQSPSDVEFDFEKFTAWYEDQAQQRQGATQESKANFDQMLNDMEQKFRQRAYGDEDKLKNLDSFLQKMRERYDLPSPEAILNLTTQVQELTKAILPENANMIAALEKVKLAVVEVSKTIIATKSAERYDPNRSLVT